MALAASNLGAPSIPGDKPAQDSLLDPLSADADRAHGMIRANTALMIAAIVAAIVVPLRFGQSFTAGFWTVTAILVALPVVFGLCVVLARNGWVWSSAGSALAASATAALVVAFVQPALLAMSGIVFLLSAVLVVSALFLPFKVALGLAAFNAVGAAAAPTFLPEAGATTIEVPYLFLGVNAFLFIAYAAVRQRELDRFHRTSADLSLQRSRVLELEESAGHMKLQHQMQLADLTQQHRDQQAFLSAASHELRTPLTPILIQLSLLRGTDDKGLSKSQVRHLDIIERNLQRLGVLVGDLLDIARIGTGNIVIRPEPVDVEKLIQDTLESFQDQAQHKGLDLAVAIQGPLPVEADATRISQVLYNLISNAIKFAPTGGNVKVIAYREMEGIQVRVQDDGPGLTDAQQAKLFKPFSQVHGAGAPSGTGLGLYISHGILEQHNGRVWAESDGAGKGSTFSFWLPQVHATDDVQAGKIEEHEQPSL